MLEQPSRTCIGIHGFSLSPAQHQQEPEGKWLLLVDIIKNFTFNQIMRHQAWVLDTFYFCSTTCTLILWHIWVSIYVQAVCSATKKMDPPKKNPISNRNFFAVLPLVASHITTVRLNVKLQGCSQAPNIPQFSALPPLLLLISCCHHRPLSNSLISSFLGSLSGTCWSMLFVALQSENSACV